MTRIKLFREFTRVSEAIANEIEYGSSLQKAVGTSASRKAGKPESLVGQISKLKGSFNEEQFGALIKRIKEDARAEYGGRSGDPLEIYIQDMRKKQRSTFISLIELIKKALEEMKTKEGQLYSDTQDILKYGMKTR